jgi:hypothetical protein
MHVGVMANLSVLKCPTSQIPCPFPLPKKSVKWPLIKIHNMLVIFQSLTQSDCISSIFTATICHLQPQDLPCTENK